MVLEYCRHCQHFLVCCIHHYHLGNIRLHYETTHSHLIPNQLSIKFYDISKHLTKQHFKEPLTFFQVTYIGTNLNIRFSHF